MKKNLLFVIESLGCGGAEKSLLSLLPLLDKTKYNIYIWMIHDQGAFKPLLSKDISVVNQPHYNCIENLFRFLSSIVYSIVWRFLRFIKKTEYWGETFYKYNGWSMKVPDGKWDTVIAYHQGLVTYLVADKFHNCKKIGWVNADIFKTGYNIKFNSKYYRKFDYICPVSDILHEKMKRNMPEFSSKYHTIWDIINPNITKGLAKEKVNILRRTKDDIIIVTTGRLHRLKGYDYALEAALELKKKNYPFKWFFIGDGPERANIEKTINDNNLQNNVYLLGFQINPYAYMNQADIYVQTSRHEGFGMTIGEAKILGIPIVSTNFDVVYNQLTHEKNGLIAEMNGKAIADQISRYIENPDLRNQICNSLSKEQNRTHLTEVAKVEMLIDY